MSMENDAQFNLSDYLSERRRMVDAHLQRLLPEAADNARIVAAMRHSLFAGGKRLRPILCLAAAESVGGSAEAALPAAAALEMIHTYSLIHDDLPAMDDDDLRRGQATCHRAFDEATALLAGDGLLTLAFQVLAEAGLENKKDAGTWLQVTSEIAVAAGYSGMIEGQMRDLAAEGKTISRSELEATHRRKTGALICAAVTSGARVGGGDSLQIERLSRYAGDIGLAFQIVDDILNVEGDPELMGKAVGSDTARNKSTYPALLGLETARQLAEQTITSALQAIDLFDKKADPLKAIARYVTARNR
ncbi:MAG TPA: polyprenyl synthetase family protein [Desulfobacterales bacterium]